MYAETPVPREASIVDMAASHVSGLERIAKSLRYILDEVRGPRPEQVAISHGSTDARIRTTLMDSVIACDRLESEIDRLVSELRERLTTQHLATPANEAGWSGQLQGMMVGGNLRG